MLKPLIVLPVVLSFAFSPQQPAATPAAPAAAPTTQAAAAPAAPSAPADVPQAANPVKPTPESLAKAKKQFSYDCAMCHGDNGNGKGDLVADMKLTIKDYTDPAALKDMSDGELFAVIKNGKGKMPADGGRTKPGDMWNLVNLVRSFSKK